MNQPRNSKQTEQEHLQSKNKIRGKHKHTQVCLGRFQDIAFPRCTIIFQDLRDSGLLVSPRCTKIPKIDLPNCAKILRFIKHDLTFSESIQAFSNVF